MLIVSTQMHSVNAMDKYKETIERLGDNASVDCKSEHQEGKSSLTTVSLGSPKNKRKVDEAVDPITRKTQQSIIEQQDVIKFHVFFQTFKNETDIIWKDRAKTKDIIIEKYIRSVDQMDFDNNKHEHAHNAQAKVHEHYVQHYTALYQKLYLAHYKTAAPKDVAQHFAAERYSHQQSEECCVIL